MARKRGWSGSDWGIKWDSSTQRYLALFLVKGPGCIPFISYVSGGEWIVFINLTKGTVKLKFPNSPFKADASAEQFSIKSLAIAVRRVHPSAIATSFVFSTEPSLRRGGPPDGPAVIVG